MEDESCALIPTAQEREEEDEGSRELSREKYDLASLIYDNYKTEGSQVCIRNVS